MFKGKSNFYDYCQSDFASSWTIRHERMNERISPWNIFPQEVKTRGEAKKEKKENQYLNNFAKMFRGF